MVSLEARALRRQLGNPRFFSTSVRAAGRWRDGPRAAARRPAASGHRRPAARRLRARVGRQPRSRSRCRWCSCNEDISPGLKRGGVLNIVRREVELVCPADAIPAEIDGRPQGVRHRRQRPHQPRRAARRACARRSPIATSRSRPSRRRPWSGGGRGGGRGGGGRGRGRGREPKRARSRRQAVLCRCAPCCCWSGSAIPAPATPATATTSASWRVDAIARTHGFGPWRTRFSSLISEGSSAATGSCCRSRRPT